MKSRKVIDSFAATALIAVLSTVAYAQWVPVPAVKTCPAGTLEWNGIIHHFGSIVCPIRSTCSVTFDIDLETGDVTARPYCRLPA